MCDLFGLSCNHKDRATISLKQFAKETSEIYSHGWGIAFFNNEHGIVERASDDEAEIPAKENERFSDVVKEARSKNILAHTRRSTCGTHCELDCHPFKAKYFGRDWIFAHNGQVKHKFDLHPSAGGETDSETIFLELMDYTEQFVNQHDQKIHGLYPAIKKALKKILDKSAPINLNFLLTDGYMYYVFNHYTSKPMYMLRRAKSTTKPTGPAILLSTQELQTPNNEPWEKIPPDQLLVLNCGQIIVLSDKIPSLPPLR